MKTYKIAYAFYPFNMENLTPEVDYVTAENLNEAFAKVEEKYGDSVEIFTAAAKKYYKE